MLQKIYVWSGKANMFAQVKLQLMIYFIMQYVFNLLLVSLERNEYINYIISFPI